MAEIATSLASLPREIRDLQDRRRRQRIFKAFKVCLLWLTPDESSIFALKRVKWFRNLEKAFYGPPVESHLSQKSAHRF
jgi:hypothetical protein